MEEPIIPKRFTFDYINKLRDERGNVISTPARIFNVDREKGVIEMSVKAFETWENTPIGIIARQRMTKFEIDHFDYWMYDKKLHRKQKIKSVVEFIQWLQKIDEDTEYVLGLRLMPPEYLEYGINDSLNNKVMEYTEKIAEIKHSFRFRLFWYNLYLGTKTFLTKELLHFQNFFNFKTP